MDKVEAFETWAASRGITRNSCDIYYTEHAGYGLRATNDLPSETELVRVPYDCFINANSLRNGDSILQGTLESVEALDDKVSDKAALIIKVGLIYYKLHPETQNLRAYMGILPQEPPAPLLWKNEQLEKVKGTTLHRAVERKQSALQREFNILLDTAASNGWPHRPGIQDLEWADIIYRSRALGVEDSLLETLNDWRKQSIDPPKSLGKWYAEIFSDANLIPCIDFANHTTASNARWKVQIDVAEEYAFTVSAILVAERSITKGEEITISYGHQLSNMQLCYTYSFILPFNPFRKCSLPIHSLLQEDLIAGHLKSKWLREMKLEPLLTMEGVIENTPTNMQVEWPQESLCAMLLIVLNITESDQDEGFEGFTICDDNGIMQLRVGDHHVESPPELLEYLEEHPLGGVIYLRAASIALQALEVALETKDSASFDSPDAISKEDDIVTVICQEEKQILKSGTVYLQNLQLELLDRQDVQAYLSSHQELS